MMRGSKYFEFALMYKWGLCCSVSGEVWGIDADMGRIVDFCYRYGLVWEVNILATKISFRPYYCKPGEGIIATFSREDDPDYVLEWLLTYMIFKE